MTYTLPAFDIFDVSHGTFGYTDETVQRLIAEAVAAEREACALTIERMVHGNVRTCASAIRARSEGSAA